MKRLVVFIVACGVGAAGTIGCQSMGERTAKGTGIGAAAGAGVGAILGHQSGNRGKGAIIGGAAGALLGGALGRKMDKQAEELKRVADTQRTEEGILTKLKSDILFDTGKASLKPAAVANVGELADILKKYPENRITVVGHTDSTGSADLNQRLSEQRAQAVKLQLTARGVPSANVQTVGMGPSQPVSPNASADGRASNRRVELQITMVEGEQAKK